MGVANRRLEGTLGDKPGIEAPNSAIGELRYDQECRAALSPAFDELVERATSAGWDPLRVCYELLYLASDKAGQLKDGPPSVAPDLKSSARTKER